MRRVLIEDFEHFHDRGVHYDEENDPIGANYFGMRGQKWKYLRQKVTPPFAPEKLINMFPAIEKHVLLCRDHLRAKVANGKETILQLKEEMVSLLMNLTASTIFGFELNTFENPNHEFRKIGESFFADNARNAFNNAGFFLCPTLLQFLKVSFLTKATLSYVINTVRNVMEMRKADPSAVRKDFIQVMLDLIENQEAAVSDENRITLKKCAATLFVFYIGSFETTSSAIAYCIYELGTNHRLSWLLPEPKWTH